jgi:hypothetical protein
VPDQKKTSKKIESNERYKNDRHNVNARTAAALEPEGPRIKTDHL